MKPISVRELVEVHHALLSLSNVQTCLWYCVAKNLGKTKHEFNTYLEVERACIDNLVQKDFENNPVTTENGSFVFETEDKRKQFDKYLHDEQSKIIEVDFYQCKITDEFIKEKHSASLITPLIDLILTE